MKQLKVKKKEVIIFNACIFLLLSFFFLFIQNAYLYHVSPFSLVYFEKGIQLFWYIAIVLLISINTIWNHHSSSRIMFQISIFLVSFKVLEGLFLEFNKIIVIALFLYITISYFLYQLLGEYLDLASINPNYNKNDLFKPLLRDIPCKIVGDNLEINGTLSNWDEQGCFIKLQNAAEIPNEINIKILFRDREFLQTGEVVAFTPDLFGVGIRFHKTNKKIDVFNWSEFVEIVDELGFLPERLR